MRSWTIFSKKQGERSPCGPNLQGVCTPAKSKGGQTWPPLQFKTRYPRSYGIDFRTTRVPVSESVGSDLPAGTETDGPDGLLLPGVVPPG